MMIDARETSSQLAPVAQAATSRSAGRVATANVPTFETLFQRAELGSESRQATARETSRVDRERSDREAERGERPERTDRAERVDRDEGSDRGERAERGQERSELNEAGSSARDDRGEWTQATGEASRGESAGAVEGEATKGSTDDEGQGQEELSELSLEAAASASLEVVTAVPSGDATKQDATAAQASAVAGAQGRQSKGEATPSATAVQGKGTTVAVPVEPMTIAPGSEGGGAQGETNADGDEAGKSAPTHSAESASNVKGHATSALDKQGGQILTTGMNSGTESGTNANGQGAGGRSAVSAAQVGHQAGPGGQQALTSALGNLSDAEGAGADGDVNAARIARALTGAVRHQGGSVTIRMTPPELGTVRVELMVKQGTVSAQFHAEHESVRQMLSQRLGQLHQALESQGLSVERLGVGSSQNGGGASFREDQGFGAPQDGRSRGQMDQGRRERDGQGDGSGGGRDARRFDQVMVDSAE